MQPFDARFKLGGGLLDDRFGHSFFMKLEVMFRFGGGNFKSTLKQIVINRGIGIGKNHNRENSPHIASGHALN